MIKNVDLVTIPVRDQQRALKFYTEKLGFSVLTDQPFDENQRWIELTPPGFGPGSAKVVLFTPPGQKEGAAAMSNITFASDNVEKTYAELSRRGVEFVAPPEKQPWGTFAVFKDPEGNSFCLATK